jgi:hypothetical protein
MNQQFITQKTLEDAGIDLTGEDVEALLVHLNELLQERVGTEITEALSDEKLKTLIDMQESATEEELGAWMEENVPDLQDIVTDEIDILLGEIVEGDDETETPAN